MGVEDEKQYLETPLMALEKNENYFELTDDSDRASAIEAQFNEDALEEARRKTAPETNPDFDGKHCIECGEKIPAARLKLMKIRCIDCQSLKEQKTKFFGG
jgi:phage/conjugal plasmid C-4 type zinc finger TraR family protein